MLLHPHMVTGPRLDHCLSHPVPSSHRGTLRLKEAGANQRPRWRRTYDFRNQMRSFKQGFGVLRRVKLGVSHQGWLRSLIGGDPPRGKGEGRIEALLHDEARGGGRTRYLFKQNPGVGVGGEALTGSLSSQTVSAGKEGASR